MRARVRRRQPAENAPSCFPAGMRVRLAGKTRSTWEGRFLRPDEDQHPHAERLDDMTEAELVAEATNVLATIDRLDGERNREHQIEYLIFELWLIREVGKRKGIK